MSFSASDRRVLSEWPALHSERGRTLRFSHATLARVAISDKSNGYEEIAQIYIAGRGRSVSGIGPSVVTGWSKTLPDGATVLDLGCGTRVPITKTLIERGLNVYGIDPAPSMIAAFRARFPTISVECAAVEDSDFFGRTFEGVAARGPILSPGRGGPTRIDREDRRCPPQRGQTAVHCPQQFCTWTDGMTDRPSISLGHDLYRNALEAEGLSLVETVLDVGENYYYFAQKK